MQGQVNCSKESESKRTLVNIPRYAAPPLFNAMMRGMSGAGRSRLARQLCAGAAKLGIYAAVFVTSNSFIIHCTRDLDGDVMRFRVLH